MIGQLHRLLQGLAVTGLFFAGSSVDAQADMLYFDESLVHSYMHNPDLQAERELLKATDEGVAQAVSGFRPSVTAAYGRGNQRVSVGGATANYSHTDNRSIRLDQPLFRGFGTYHSFKSSKAQVQAQRHALKNAEQNTLLDAATAYVDVLRTRRLLELSSKNEAVLSKHLKATRDRFSVGEVTKTDVAQAEARLSLATSERVQAEADVEIANSTFERIVLDIPGEKLEAHRDVYDLLPSLLDEAIDLARENNPTLLQQLRTEDAARYTIGVQRAQLYPTVDLVGSVRRDEGNAQFSNQNFRSDSITVNVNIPLYQSGRVYSLVRQAKRQHSQTALETRDTLNRVREAVTRGWEQLDASKATIKATSDAIKAARLALEGVEQEHLYGARTTLDVLDAEQELFEAEVNLTTAERNEAVAQYNLAVLLGNFTVETLALPVEPYDDEAYYDDNAYKMLGF